MILNQILAMFIAHLGIYVGLALGINSPEEMKPGKRYFDIMVTVFYGIIAAFPFLYIIWEPVNPRHYALAIIFIALILLQLMNVDPFAINTLLGLELALFLGTAYFFPLAILMFLYGLPQGSLIVEPYAKNKEISRSWKQLLKDTWAQQWGFFTIIIGLLGFFFFLP